ncbi:hypothetical protein T11_5938, partial [Trichinella zimbabwensis]
LDRDKKKYEENESIVLKNLTPHDQAFIKARKEAAAGQSRSAAKMTRRSMKMPKPLHIGQNITLRVPDVNRGPVDLKNFLVEDCTLLATEKENWHITLQLQIYK